METKVCNTCNVVKTINEFDEDRKYMKKDGTVNIYHKAKCKDCNKDKYREIINANRREEITCSCGCTLSKGALNRHKKSQQHINSTN